MPSIKFDVNDVKPLLSTLQLGQAPPPPPDMSKLAPPPPPQATPAVAGFNEWSSDPMNQQKVGHAITPPGQPIIPPDVRAQATQMASLTPPPTPNFASLAGPPNMPAAPAIKVQPTPDPNAGLSSKLNADQAELQRLQSTGSGVSQIKNRGLRIAARIGDAAGTVLAPGVMSVIPGTTVHNWTEQNLKQGQIAGDQSALKDAANLQDVQSQTAQRSAMANKANAQADAVGDPEVRKQKQIQDAAKLGMKPVYDGQGNLTGYAPDDESPIAKSRALKDQLVSAQVDNTKAQKELRDAQAALAKAKNDPNSPAFRQAQQRLQVAQQNANAAGTRAQAYMGRYMQSAYNTGLNGDVLPGAPIITNEQGAETPVGTGNATSATKNQSNTAMFNEVGNATTDIENKATNLVQKGGRLNDPDVAAAIADPKTTSTQWAQGQFITSGLSPEQRDYVIAVKAYHERLQPLRKSAGGGVSDAQVDRLMQMAPGAGTPDLDYLKRQTAAIRQLQGNLSAGATTSKGGLKIQPATPPPTTGTAPSVKVGQQVKLKNGQTITIKVVHPDGSFE